MNGPKKSTRAPVKNRVGETAALGGTMRSLGRVVALLAVVAAAAACDPEYRYRPVGLDAVGPGVWRLSAPGIEVTTDDLWNIVGTRTISPEFQVYNGRAGAIVMTSAELVIGVNRYPARAPAAEWRTIQPGSTQRVPFSWTFEEDPRDMLGSSPRMIVRFEVNGVSEEFEILYERMR